MTIRFPTGVSVTYNRARFVVYGANAWELYESSEKKHWIAAVPATGQFIIEGTGEGHAENPLEGKTVEGAVNLLLKGDALRRAPRYLVGNLKGKLEEFNRKTHQWKSMSD